MVGTQKVSENRPDEVVGGEFPQKDTKKVD